MCTAITYLGTNHYFGRNLDLEYAYEESVTITPRNYTFTFRNGKVINSHYAMIGMAYVTDDYPLYYEATNEKGLSVGGLNFVGNAYYQQAHENKDNIAQFELVPWILCQCTSVEEVLRLLKNINITDTSFRPDLPASQLHWMIADRQRAITVEAVKDGLKIYENQVGVLTNNPPFDMQLFYLSNYMGLSAEQPKNCFSEDLKLEPYSRGMGAMGLPGDLSSASRFVKAAFTRLNAKAQMSEESEVSQFFHILGSVEQQRGCVYMGEGKYEITLYSSCCNTDRGIYYYRTYENSQISAVDMHERDLDGNSLITISPIWKQQIKWQ